MAGPLQNQTDETVWAELRDDKGNPFAIDEVDGDVVYVRPIDPGDAVPGRIQLDPGQHTVEMSTIGAIGLHSGDTAGADDMMFSLRVVPDGRDDGVVYGRTLRFDEPDDGRRVHVRPGEIFTLRAGSISVALEAIDAMYREVDPERPEGSLAAALRVWYGLGPSGSPEVRLLAGAAAHRLDAAEHLLRRANSIGLQLRGDGDLGGPLLVTKVDEYVHLVQEGIVALARCIAVVKKGIGSSLFPVDPLAEIDGQHAAIKAIRDAYEHIDERAVGRLVHGVVDERAFMIFNHESLLLHGEIEYLEHRLELALLRAVLDSCRSTIKELVGGPPSGDTSGL